MVKRYIFIFLLALTTTAFGQSQRENDTEVSGVNPRLEQLEDYLRQKGMKIAYDLAHIGEKNSKLRQTWCGIKTMKDKEVDSICSVINDLSRNAIESHMYEFHKNGTDTIDYVVMLNDKEEVEFEANRTESDNMFICYCHTYRTEKGKGSVAVAIAERHWRIDINTMNTMRYGSRTVTPDFYLELRGDTLRSYLPYLGQAQVSTTLAPAIGLNFEEVVMRYWLNKPKSKKYVQLYIDARTREDTYHFVIDVYDDGKAFIRVRSQNRDPISFDGTLSTELY
ncbi:MAG: DUF4251 domain-containing protein [Prevotella sp.]|nr:DUF4251 domain-containing protein [Prevotella sp.]